MFVKIKDFGNLIHGVDFEANTENVIINSQKICSIGEMGHGDNNFTEEFSYINLEGLFFHVKGTPEEVLDDIKAQLADGEK